MNAPDPDWELDYKFLQDVEREIESQGRWDPPALEGIEAVLLAADAVRKREGDDGR